jgi:4-amino-4-deoxy-L-arabinose transferase-like glycosyltransferase
MKNSQQSSVIRRSNYLWLILVVALALLIFLPLLGKFGLLDPSDALYSEGAREMVESGNYITPYVNYFPFYEKPILIY